MEQLYASIFCFLSIISIINCASVPIVEKSLNVSQPGPNLLNKNESQDGIPISCRCIPTIENCGGELIKIVETNCTKDYAYCCIRDMKPLDNKNDTTTTITTNNTTILENPTTNSTNSTSTPQTGLDEKTDTGPRIKIRIPSVDDTRPIATDELVEDKNEKEKANKKCICISRNDCPSEYVDYTFGFYCSYATVHCCLPPQAQPQPQEIDERQCLCVEPDECNYESALNTLEERKDMFCPYNQVKCCGSHIRRKIEKRINTGVVDVDGNDNENDESPYNMSLEQDQQFNGKDEQGVKGPGVVDGGSPGFDAQGQSHGQGLLTVQNVPMNQGESSQFTGQTYGIPIPSSPASQHDLLNHYNLQPPNLIPHVDITNPNTFNQPPAQRSPVREYMGQYWKPGQEPVYRNYPNNDNNYISGNSNMRQPITTQIRSFGNPPPSPGILDSISNFFFG